MKIMQPVLPVRLNVLFSASSPQPYDMTPCYGTVTRGSSKISIFYSAVMIIVHYTLSEERINFSDFLNTFL